MGRKIGKRGSEDTLGGRVTRRRVDKGWSQQRLAAVVKTSQAVIQRIETGKCAHPRILEVLAAALDVTPAWLLYGVTPIEGLSVDALDVARTWAALPELQRHRVVRMFAEQRHAGAVARANVPNFRALNGRGIAERDRLTVR